MEAEVRRDAASMTRSTPMTETFQNYMSALNASLAFRDLLELPEHEARAYYDDGYTIDQAIDAEREAQWSDDGDEDYDTEDDG
jgi:hypothetical protein